MVGGKRFSTLTTNAAGENLLKMPQVGKNGPGNLTKPSGTDPGGARCRKNGPYLEDVDDFCGFKEPGGASDWTTMASREKRGRVCRSTQRSARSSRSWTTFHQTGHKLLFQASIILI